VIDIVETSLQRFQRVVLMRAKGKSAANAVVAMTIVIINATANPSFVVMRRSFLQFTLLSARSSEKRDFSKQSLRTSVP
jgi:hypothetical protein